MSSPERTTVRGWLRDVRAALAGNTHDHTSGRLGRALTLLAVPMVLEMVMESIFAVVDIYFVSQVGPEAVAAVGLTESVITLVYAVAIGLAMATTATVARRVGEGRDADASRAAWQALLLGLGVSAVLGCLGWFFADDLLGFMSRSDDAADAARVVEVGSGYTRIALTANVVIMLLFLQNAVFRGAGDAVLAMRRLWLANGINLVLDPCLIFGLGPFPEMGVTGAATATVIGRGCGVAYQHIALRRGVGRIRLDPTAATIDLATMGKLLRVSAGGIGQFLVATSSWIVLMKVMAQFGSQALAGYTVAVRVVMFALLPSWGLANAAATLVGQNLGANKPERSERAVYLAGKANTVVLACITVLFVWKAEAIVGLFGGEPPVVAVGAQALRIMSLGYVAYAWGMVLCQAFNGAGDTGTPTKLNLICFWLLQIPVAYGLATHTSLGPAGVFWAVTGSEAVLTLLSLWLFRRGRWRSVQV